jgi:hypothetical protein
MGERISPSTRIPTVTFTPAEAENRARTSIDNVVAVLNNPVLFPWIESSLITGYNSTCDGRQIDIITYTNEAFACSTGLDTVCAQVKSAESDMNWLLGVIGTNGKIHHAKFLHHTHREWVATSLTFINGQWCPDLIAADFMFQVCALSGHWRDLATTYQFAEKFFPPESVRLMKKNFHYIIDFRGKFLDWVILGLQELDEKPIMPCMRTY